MAIVTLTIKLYLEMMMFLQEFLQPPQLCLGCLKLCLQGMRPRTALGMHPRTALGMQHNLQLPLKLL